MTEFKRTRKHLYVKDVFRWNEESDVTIYGRSSHTSFVLEDKLYIIGGMDNKSLNQYNCSDDILIYDISKSFFYQDDLE